MHYIYVRPKAGE